MPKSLIAALSLAALLAAGPTSLAGQAVPSVGRAPGSHMHMLLQRTLLKVDVLSVDVCFDDATARRFVALAAGGRLSGARADSVTRAALASGLAVGRVAFRRDIALADFLEGVGEDLRIAVTAGLLADSVYRAVAAGLPGWYAPLQRRGIRRGDVLEYEMQPEAVRTRFTSAAGEVLLDRTERGRARRNSPLAAWLAPGSQFRAGLLESLRPRRGGTCPFTAASR